MYALRVAARRLFWVAATALLSACGGGGGGGGSDPAVPQAPTISVQPQSTAVVVGAQASFNVAAAGTAPLRYQWQRGGVDIVGATGPSYTLSSAALTDSGAQFGVVVQNDVGTTPSGLATLTVTAVPALSITSQPLSVSVPAGSGVNFVVGATGGPGLAYQWRKNGADIVGATAATLSVGSVALTDSGSRFSVHVTDGAASIDSIDAVLTVTAAPPVSVASSQLSAGIVHSLGLRSDGSVLAWGENSKSQLSSGALLAGSTARVVSGLVATSIAAGNGRSLAAGRDGKVYGWGWAVFNGEDGTLGSETIRGQSYPTPRDLGGVSNAVAVVAVTGQSLALTSTGVVRHWPGAATFNTDSVTVTPGLVAGLTDVAKIVPGLTAGGTTKSHPLAVKTDGTVWELSWAITQTFAPPAFTNTYTYSVRQLSGLSGVVDVSCATHCLAVKRDGRVVAWGDNSAGQLGIGVVGPASASPMDVQELADVKLVGAANLASVAVTRAGRVYSWGGADGFVGIGSSPELNGQRLARRLVLPAEVQGLGSAQSLAASDSAVLIALGDGSVWSWGMNGAGQLGSGPATGRNFPAVATGITLLTSTVTITAQTSPSSAAVGQTASFSVAATAGAGSPSYQWMRNGIDIPGANASSYVTPVLSQSDDDSFYSVRVSDASGPRTSRGAALTVTATPTSANKPGRVFADRTYAYGLTAGASATATWAWGDGSAVGTGSPIDKVWRKPGSFTAQGASEAAFGVVAVGAPLALGDRHACALKADNTLACWGRNAYGQLGDGSVIDKAFPTPVTGLTGVVSVGAGVDSTCALKASGSVSCWGRNANGELGDGTLIDRFTPTDVPGLNTVVSLAVGDFHACALRADGVVLCWGDNFFGAVGDGSSTNKRVTPTPVSGLTDAVSIAAGSGSCAVRRSGAVVCWGSLGIAGAVSGFDQDQRLPTAVGGLANVVSVRFGGSHVCALRSDRQVLCWGNNDSGQIGDGSATARSTPMLVSGLDNAVDIAPGTRHSCALKADGTVVCWGTFFGEGPDGVQLVDNAHLLPIPIPGAERSNALRASGTATCAAGADGRVRCWGGALAGGWNSPVPLRDGASYWK